MGISSLELYGQALTDYYAGKTDATILVRRDDGFSSELPVAVFFRSRPAFSTIENMALERCRGTVLDIGAGSGSHTLALRENGFQVVAIDVVPRAVRMMEQRGVTDARCADIFTFHDQTFDTAIMLGHGIGIVSDPDGLKRFLERMHHLLRPQGQLLFDSTDIFATDDPLHLAYHAANRQAGRYSGEIRMLFEYADQTGEWMKWLHVDPRTLEKYAHAANWNCRVLRQEPAGDYLVCLTH